MGSIWVIVASLLCTVVHCSIVLEINNDGICDRWNGVAYECYSGLNSAFNYTVVFGSPPPSDTISYRFIPVSGGIKVEVFSSDDNCLGPKTETTLTDADNSICFPPVHNPSTSQLVFHEIIDPSSGMNIGFESCLDNPTVDETLLRESLTPGRVGECMNIVTKDGLSFSYKPACGSNGEVNVVPYIGSACLEDGALFPFETNEYFEGVMADSPRFSGIQDYTSCTVGTQLVNSYQHRISCNKPNEHPTRAPTPSPSMILPENQNILEKQLLSGNSTVLLYTEEQYFSSKCPVASIIKPNAYWSQIANVCGVDSEKGSKIQCEVNSEDRVVVRTLSYDGPFCRGTSVPDDEQVSSSDGFLHCDAPINSQVKKVSCEQVELRQMFLVRIEEAALKLEQDPSFLGCDIVDDIGNAVPLDVEALLPNGDFFKSYTIPGNCMTMHEFSFKVTCPSIVDDENAKMKVEFFQDRICAGENLDVKELESVQRSNRCAIYDFSELSLSFDARISCLYPEKRNIIPPTEIRKLAPISGGFGGASSVAASIVIAVAFTLYLVVMFIRVGDRDLGPGGIKGIIEQRFPGDDVKHWVFSYKGTGVAIMKTKKKTNIMVQPTRRNSKIPFKELELIESIAAGAIGTISLGRYKGTEVAIKEILCAADDPSDANLNQFRNEMEFLNRIEHPSIVRCFGQSSTESKDGFVRNMMILELAKCSLKSVLDNAKSGDASYSIAVAMAWIEGIYSGLTYLHNQGIVHNDVKPGNILIYDDGGVKLCDFGCAVSRKPTDIILSNTNGTPTYMAPERLEQWGKESNEFTVASDVYSVAIILWEMLHVGKSPLPDGWSITKVAGEVCERNYRPHISKDVPKNLATIISTSWMKQAADRPQSDSLLQEISLLLGEYNAVQRNIQAASTLKIGDRVHLWDGVKLKFKKGIFNICSEQLDDGGFQIQSESGGKKESINSALLWTASDSTFILT